MKLSIVKVEVLPSLRGQPRVRQNFKAIAWLCLYKKTFGRFLSFSASDTQHFLPLHRFSIPHTYRENRVLKRKFVFLTTFAYLNGHS